MRVRQVLSPHVYRAPPRPSRRWWVRVLRQVWRAL